MTRYQVSSTGTIPVSPSRVYAVIADYRVHHPRIVPPEYFQKVEVTEGGVGAGTRTRIVMRVLGTTREFEHIITEPEPGRVLVEADPDGLGGTTFTVDRGDSNDSTRLTITTEAVARPGVAGAAERVLSSMLLRRIHRKEIARIAEYVAQL
jgi:Polyketide cyclase / dehydrase and lipid transport